MVIGLFTIHVKPLNLHKICVSAVKFRNVRAATDESQKTRNKNQETKRFSTFAVYRLRHSETKKKHCLIRESSFSGACAKEPINNLSQVTWLCTWLPK